MNPALAERVAGLLASEGGRDCTWLDGGDGRRGIVGGAPDVVVESDDLGVLATIDAAWRERPEAIWTGWITYDLGADRLLGRPPRSHRLPGVLLRRHAGALEVVGERVIAHGSAAACAELQDRLATAPPPPPEEPWPFSPLRPALSPAAYRDQVEAVRALIVAGETYQVNLSQAFSAAWRERPADLRRAAVGAYRRLRRRTPAPMGALMGWGEAVVLSNSPETLLEVRGHTARSLPIKGTSARHADAALDARSLAALIASEKDAAEHLMIVDLVRNDLGRLARPGTVRVEPRRAIALPSVHHLETEVRAELARDFALPDLLALFPGGSVTGAPKRRTVEIIDALESGPRGLYCGAVLLLHPEGLTASIPIRTAVVDAAGIAVRSGGGIVHDSDPESERLEAELKTRAFAP